MCDIDNSNFMDNLAKMLAIPGASIKVDAVDGDLTFYGETGTISDYALFISCCCGEKIGKVTVTKEAVMHIRSLDRGRADVFDPLVGYMALCEPDSIDKAIETINAMLNKHMGSAAHARQYYPALLA